MEDVRVKPYWGYQGQTSSNFGVYATFGELTIGEVDALGMKVYDRAVTLVDEARGHAVGEFTANMDKDVRVEPCGNGLARVYVVIRCVRGGDEEAHINGVADAEERARRAERKAAKKPGA